MPQEKITPGMLVFVKTTGEQGQVLSLNTETLPEFYDKAGFCGETAMVKVPKATKEFGIQMVAVLFAIEELETTKDRQQREYEDMFGMSELMGKKAPKMELKDMETAGTDEDLPN
jgi:hypothetical protein